MGIEKSQPPEREHIISNHNPNARGPLQRKKNVEAWPLTITHKEQPVPLSRPRVAKAGGVYLPRHVKDYKARLTATIQRTVEDKLYQTLEGICSVECFFYFDIPKSYTKRDRYACVVGDRKPVNSDIDNLVKMVFDACQDAGVFKDDRQVWRLHGEKGYAQGNPHTKIVVSPHRTV